MMFAPLRSVFAMQFMACDLDASPSETVSSSFKTVALPSGHCQHMQGKAAATDRASYQVDHAAQNCCTDDGPCNSSCHFSVTASLFMQCADYSPALLNSDTFENISSTLLVRELNPPSRPPLAIYS